MDYLEILKTNNNQQSLLFPAEFYFVFSKTMSSKHFTLPTTIFKNTFNIVSYSANKTEAIRQEFLSPFKYQIHLHLPILFLLTTSNAMSYLPILDRWSKKIYHFF